MRIYLGPWSTLPRAFVGTPALGQIFVSSAVRELSVGKPIVFEDRGPIALKGFDDPVRLFEVPLSD